MRNHKLAVIFCIYTVVMAVLMLTLHDNETIPFHMIFLGLTLVYGYSLWNRRTSLFVLGFATVVSGAVLVRLAMHGDILWEESTETLLMPAIFLGTMWHFRRRAVEQERAEQMASEQARLVERERQFMQDAAHALRTPLTIARGHVDLAQAAVADEQVREDLDVVIAQLERLSHLATTLVTLDQIATEHDQLRDAVNMSEMVTHLHHRWARSTDRHWELMVDRSPNEVLADGHLMEMALEAILENAVNHTTTSDRIRLSAETQGNSVIVRIDDSGPGVPLDEREHVFLRFARGNAAQRHSGSGLGLSLVRAVAESHGGTAVISDSPLGGAAVILTLPAFVGLEPQASISPSAVLIDSRSALLA